MANKFKYSSKTKKAVFESADVEDELKEDGDSAAAKELDDEFVVREGEDNDVDVDEGDEDADDDQVYSEEDDDAEKVEESDSAAAKELDDEFVVREEEDAEDEKALDESDDEDTDDKVEEDDDAEDKETLEESDDEDADDSEVLDEADGEDDDAEKLDEEGDSAAAKELDDEFVVREGEEEDDAEKVDEEEMSDDDIETLLKSANLDESAFQTVKTVFTAAVATKLKQEKKLIESRLKRKYAKQLSTVKESVLKQVDLYTNQVVKDWYKENKLALENKVQNIINAQFVTEQKALLQKYNVDLKANQVDLFTRLSENHSELEAQYRTVVKENKKLENELNNINVQKIVAEYTESMSAIQKDRFETMLEAFEFENLTEFKQKAKLLSETLSKVAPSQKVKFKKFDVSNKESALLEGINANSADDIINETVKLLRK